MKFKIKTFSGSSIKEFKLSDEVFSIIYNKPLVHQIVLSYIFSFHKNSKSQKDRSDVSGGGVKPWRQKGMGRARAGSIRSPIFRKGGVTFAAKYKFVFHKVNRKMYRLSIKSIFSELIRENRLLIIDSFNLDTFKTKEFILKFHDIGIKGSLIIVDIVEFTDKLYFSSRNISGLSVFSEIQINPIILMSFDKIICTKNSIKSIEKRLS